MGTIAKKFRSLEEVAGSGVTITLDDQELTFKPLRLRDYADAKMRLKSGSLAAYMAAMAAAPVDQAPPKAEQYRAHVRILRDHMDDIEVAQWFTTLEGQVYLVHRSLVQAHPDVTESDVEEMFADPKVLEQVIAAVNALDADEPSEKGGAADADRPTESSSPDGSKTSLESAEPTG